MRMRTSFGARRKARTPYLPWNPLDERQMQKIAAELEAQRSFK
jgi:hypothetical protein